MSANVNTTYRTVKINNQGVSIAVHDAGGKDGDALLVVHAAGFQSLAYLPMVPMLLQRFHVFLVDLRGHGSSDAPADDQWLTNSWKCLASDVLVVVEALGIRGCYVFGHSLGGGVALLAQAMDSSAFRGIYVFEPPIWPLPVPRTPEGEDVDLDMLNQMFVEAISRRRRRFDSRAAALAYFHKHPMFSALHPHVIQALVEYGLEEDLQGGGLKLAGDPQLQGRILRAFMTCPAVTEEQLARIACPVVVGMGPEDTGGLTHFLQLSALRVAACLPSARLERYEGLLPHFGPLSAPDLVGRRVLFSLLMWQYPPLWELVPPVLILPAPKL